MAAIEIKSFSNYVSFWVTDKNSKEQFIKKLQQCMKTYDYKDETKDVKGKVSISLL